MPSVCKILSANSWAYIFQLVRTHTANIAIRFLLKRIDFGNQSLGIIRAPSVATMVGTLIKSLPWDVMTVSRRNSSIKYPARLRNSVPREMVTTEVVNLISGIYDLSTIPIHTILT